MVTTTTTVALLEGHKAKIGRIARGVYPPHRPIGTVQKFGRNSVPVEVGGNVISLRKAKKLRQREIYEREVAAQKAVELFLRLSGVTWRQVELTAKANKCSVQVAAKALVKIATEKIKDQKKEAA